MSEEEYKSLKEQLKRLDQISRNIANLIFKNDLSKINHLDKLRKKIINDIQLKNYKFEKQEKKSIVKLISQNQEIIVSLKEKRTSSLSSITNSLKCSKAYSKNIL